MRLVHLSDTHLGFSAYSKLDPVEGINQREADIYHAFEEAVDRAIELRPDVIIHSGDLFDIARPQNRAISFALNQILRVSDEGIEIVLISGNHSTPRLRETGSIFSIFEHLKHVHPIHKPEIHRVTVGDATITAIPHSSVPPLSELVGQAKPSRDTGLNVLVLHAGLIGPGDYSMGELNEQLVPLNLIADGFDYVALGHFHKYERIQERIYYSGSTERIGFGEAGQSKGFLEVDLERHSVRFHELRIRDMVDLKPIDAAGLTSSEILSRAREQLSSAVVDDKIVRLNIRNISKDAYRSLDVPAIRRLGNSALHFELKADRLESEEGLQLGSTHIGSLAAEFQRYVASLQIPEEKKKRLMEIGPPYLAEAEE
ncbi:MAG: metallophosphoesterase [Thermoplasmata archaeon]